MATRRKADRPDPFMSYKQGDFDYEQNMLKQYYNNDVKFKVTIYRINTVNTQQTGNRYHVGESRARQKVFHEPIEFTAILKTGKAVFKFLAGTGIQKQEYEEFSFNLFLADLEEKQVVIKAGDFALFNDGDQKRFFEIQTITTINSSNGGHGFKPVFNKIVATLKNSGSIPDSLKNSY